MRQFTVVSPYADNGALPRAQRAAGRFHVTNQIRGLGEGMSMDDMKPHLITLGLATGGAILGAILVKKFKLA